MSHQCLSYAHHAFKVQHYLSVDWLWQRVNTRGVGGLIVILVYLSVNSADGLGILYFLTCVYCILVVYIVL